MKDPSTKGTMQRLVKEYDHFAERAEQRAKGCPRPNRSQRRMLAAKFLQREPDGCRMKRCDLSTAKKIVC